MKNVFSKLILAASCSILPLSFVYANQLTDQKTQNYVMRVTSTDPDQQVGFTAMIMQVTQGKEPLITQVVHKTPWETTITSDYFRTMLMTDINSYPKIKIEVSEKRNDGEHFRFSGTGHALDGHLESNGTGDIVGF